MNKEMIEKMKAAKSVEEIIAVAKEFGEELTKEKAAELLNSLGNVERELSDDDLDAVAGGGLTGTLMPGNSSAFLKQPH